MWKVKKITDQQTIAETFNDYFVAIAENVKRQRKNNFINDDNNSVDNHTHFMEQAFNKPYPSMESKYTSTKEIEQIIKSLKTKNSYGPYSMLKKNDLHVLPNTFPPPSSFEMRNLASIHP
jgi:hypothetical protein